LERVHFLEELQVLRKGLSDKYGFENIVGQSQALLFVLDQVARVAPTDATVLILGETGTGKEVLAKAVHRNSLRRERPFVTINCGAIPAELLQSELFGHLRGSFTGATKDKKGLFEEADGGTLFLDEIGEMNLDLQARLLRVLEDGTFNRVGDSKSTKVDVRIIAATNKDLKHEAETNRFRLDLFYRLAVFTIHLPPLAERTEDIEILGNHFLKEFSNKLNRKIKKMDDAFLKALNQHSWKGNIRELKNVIERAVIIANGDTLTPDLLHFDFFSDSLESQGPTLNLASIESQYIRKAMSQSNGNKTEASRLLGIGLSTLYRKIEDYKL